MAIPRTNWAKRRQELRAQLGIRSWEYDSPRLEQQLEREKADEEAYLASLPLKMDRPISARDRKSKRTKRASKSKSKRR